MNDRTAAEELIDLPTERRRADLADLDQRSARELVALMNAEDRTVPDAVAAAGDALSEVVEAVVDRLAAGGRLIYLGAGTSGRLALLDAVECSPTFGLDPDQVIGIVAGGPMALSSSREDAEDDESAGAAEIERVHAGARDIVVGVSASGRTPYVLGGVRAAAALGAATAGISCASDARLSALVDHAVEILVGPEIIAGSTRLKAGTAQKLALNTISTGAMIRLGKVYGNLMVDLKPTNAKLRDRARRIVAEATGAQAQTAATALEASGGEVKTAIVALRAGVDPESARTRLAAADGSIRAALGEDGKGSA